MRFLVVVSTLLGIVSVVRWSVAQDHVAKTEPRPPAEERKGFHLPPGFEIQLVASEPAIRKPINMNFDARGRLWVTDTIEYPFPAPAGQKPRDSVKILSDFDDTGLAKKITTFADGLNIPIGVLPLTLGKDGKGTQALVYSIPSIQRLTDTDGDDQADRREVLYGTFGSQDTHGMCGSFNWGFDGWIYAHHGFANTSSIKGTDDFTIRMQSGNTFRMRPDGSRVEQFTWGQVNPFGLCFDPQGNLYSADCHTRPAYQLLRGAYYPSFGKPHDGLGFGPELMTHMHNSTALCGLAYYAADHFPREYQGTLFIGNVWTCRLNRNRIDWHGASPKAVAQPDFLTSDDPWFRPVDVKLGPDGALYVADFYNRIIGHYEVPLTHPGRDRERGRIWRIVYRGPDGKSRPAPPRTDWTKAGVSELVQALGHSNLTVRTLAANQLVERGGDAVGNAVSEGLKPDASAFQRLHGLWVLERLDRLAPAVLEAAASAKERDVRIHAQRVLERRTWSDSQRKLVLAGLRDVEPQVQRAAAEALAQHPSLDNLRPLLALRQTVPPDDAHLLHVVRMALRDQLRPVEVIKQVAAASWTEKDGRALVDVVPGLTSPESAALLVRHLQRIPESGERLQRFVQHVARYGTEETDRALLSLGRDDRADLRQQAAFFRAMQQGLQARGVRLSDAARGWADELAGKLLAAKENDLVIAGAELAGSLPLASRQEKLTALAADNQAPQPQREAAVNALVAINVKSNSSLLGRLLADAAEPPLFRDRVAQALGRVNQPEARAELLKALPGAPAGLQITIAAGLAGNPQGAEKLLETVAQGKASARLLQEKVVLTRLNESKLPNLKDRLAALTRGLPPADQRLQELLKRRGAGFPAAKADAALGAKVFEKHCAACHQVANQGAKIGPQLDGLGLRGLDRILEDLIDPNRNVDQAFRATTLALKNGQVLIGLVLREEGEVVVLADNQGKEVRVGKKTIEERTVSQLSPMPANLMEQIPEPEFHHLLAFLLAQRQPPAGGKN